MANYICTQNPCTACGNTNGSSNGNVGGVSDSINTCPCSCPSVGGVSDSNGICGISCEDFLIIAAIFLLVLTLFSES